MNETANSLAPAASTVIKVMESETKGDGKTTSHAVKAGSSEKKKQIDTKAISMDKVKSKENAEKAGSSEKKKQIDTKATSTDKVKPKEKKEVSHANSASPTYDTKEAHRNMRFWKKRSDMNKKGILQQEDAGGEFVEDRDEANQRDKLITESRDMAEETLVHEVTKEDNIVKTLDRSELAALSALQQMNCGCLADYCIPHVKDSKWEDKVFGQIAKNSTGVSNKAVAANETYLDGEMDIDQAVAAMRRSKRMQPMPIKSIEIPDNFIMTSTSSVTDSQAGYDGGVSQNRRTKIFGKLGRKSRRTDKQTEN